MRYPSPLGVIAAGGFAPPDPLDGSACCYSACFHWCVITSDQSVDVTTTPDCTLHLLCSFVLRIANSHLLVEGSPTVIEGFGQRRTKSHDAVAVRCLSPLEAITDRGFRSPSITPVISKLGMHRNAQGVGQAPDRHPSQLWQSTWNSPAVLQSIVLLEHVS